jgi:glutamate N-acetyltransferase/amino-acid N-acetyltransferase
VNDPKITEVEGGITAPIGYRAAGVASGLKPTGLDLALVVSDSLASAAGVFTTNLAVAAPVTLAKKHLEKSSGSAKAIVVNSKCANACTGERGVTAAQAMAEDAATVLECNTEQVLVASTGVIGMHLDTNKVRAGIKEAAGQLCSESHRRAAEAIMTTDISPKERAVIVKASSGSFTIGGMAKGAGMIEPNMATMLGFLTTDADVAPPLLNQALRTVVEDTFNAISVDGESSTNDTVFMLANGMSNVKITADDSTYTALVIGLTSVCSWLAQEIVRGGEGATKLVTISVVGAASNEEAKSAARLISNSPLVKTALHGGDPNWGRVLAVAGRSGVMFDQHKAEVRIGHVTLYADATVFSERESEAAQHMEGPEIDVTVDLGTGGTGRATMWTCDFSAEYVHINADYRT